MTVKVTAYLIVEPILNVSDRIVGGQVVAVRQRMPKNLSFGARPVKVELEVPPAFWDAPTATAVIAVPVVDLVAEATS